MHFDLAQTLSLAVGVVLPLLSGLVTKSSASGAVRAVVLLALSAVTAFVSAWLSAANGHQPFDVGTTLFTVLGTFLVGVGSHFGFYKATGISAYVQSVGGFIGPKPAATPVVSARI
ncbi:MAG: hypothetical protein ACREQ5_02140 [Candidatus Dormibacteria bacterium]